MVRTQKKKKTTESAVKQKKKKNKQRKQMNKIFLILIVVLFAVSACSIGKKCTYTQDGTKVSSYVWFFQGDKPIDLDKNNCN